MIKVYNYIGAWDLPCISPYVTKLVNYCAMAGVEHEVVMQPLDKLAEDAPNGKLPYITDSDGTKVGDSQACIDYLKDKYGDPLDGSMSAEEKAQALAWNRLLEEHLYWSGIIQTRWRKDRGWETYIPYIVGGAEVSAEMRTGLDQFRAGIVSQFDGQGMGRRSDEQVYGLAQNDLQAISDKLGDNPYFFGAKPHAIDASVYSTLMHILYTPFDSPSKDFGLKQKNLVDYCKRMKDQYAV